MKIKCNIHEIDVQIKTEECAEAELAGYYESENQLVALSGDLKPSQKREILIHELMHVAYDHSVLRYVPQAKRYNEELIVSSLSTIMADILCNNPHLLAFLLGNGDIDD